MMPPRSSVRQLPDTGPFKGGPDVSTAQFLYNWSSTGTLTTWGSHFWQTRNFVFAGEVRPEVFFSFFSGIWRFLYVIQFAVKSCSLITLNILHFPPKNMIKDEKWIFKIALQRNYPFYYKGVYARHGVKEWFLDKSLGAELWADMK